MRISKQTEDRMRKAALMVVAGCTNKEASLNLHLDAQSLQGYIKRHPKLWKLLLQRAHEAKRILDSVQPKREELRAEILQRMLHGAALLKQGQTMGEASKALGLRPQTLWRYARNYRKQWKEMCDVLDISLPLRGGRNVGKPGTLVRQKIARATLLSVDGVAKTEISRILGMFKNGVSQLRQRHRKLWDEEERKARKLLAIPEGKRQLSYLRNSDGKRTSRFAQRRSTGRRAPWKRPERKKTGRNKDTKLADFLDATMERSAQEAARQANQHFGRDISEGKRKRFTARYIQQKRSDRKSGRF